MTKTLYSIIRELEQEPSTNKKVEILVPNKENLLLKQFFNLCLNPFLNFYIREYTKIFDENMSTNEIDMDHLNSIIEVLAKRKLTGHAAKAWLEYLSMTLDYDSQEVLRRIISRDPACKVSVGLVNRVWGKDFISESNCMLAEKYSPKRDKEISKWGNTFYIQKKEDGGRCQIVVDFDGSVTAYSRSGNELQLHGVFDSTFESYRGYVFDGELLVVNKSSGVVKRQAGNGFMSILNTLKEKEEMLCSLKNELQKLQNQQQSTQ